MNNIRIMSIFVLTLLLASSFVMAQDLEEVEVVDPGVTPDSIFYGLDIALDKINIAMRLTCII